MIQHMLTGISAPRGAGFKAIRERQKVGGAPATRYLQLAQSASGTRTCCYRRGPDSLTPNFLTLSNWGEFAIQKRSSPLIRVERLPSTRV
jgi:hypothetical protein